MRKTLLTVCSIVGLAFAGNGGNKLERTETLPRESEVVTFETALAIIKADGICWMAEQPELTIQASYHDCGVLSAPFLFAKRASEAARPWTPDQEALFGEWACWFLE